MGKGWFRSEGREGDRTLAEQMIGLEPLVAEIRGKRVLDFGCAEGLIGMELLNRGAASVTGIDTVEDHIQFGKTLASDEGIAIELLVGNLNSYPVEKLEPADVVLLLAILHKLRDPSAFAMRAAALAKEQVIVRLPPSGAVIRDERSGYVPHDIAAVLEKAGFVLGITVRGTNDEWIGYFRRPVSEVVFVDPSPKVEPPAEPPAQALPETGSSDPEEPAAVEQVAQAVEETAQAAEPAVVAAEAPVMTTANAETPEAADAQSDDEHDEPTGEVAPMTTDSMEGRRPRRKRTSE